MINSSKILSIWDNELKICRLIGYAIIKSSNLIEFPYTDLLNNNQILTTIPLKWISLHSISRKYVHLLRNFKYKNTIEKKKINSN